MNGDGSEDGVYSSDTEKNRVILTEISEKREKLMYLVTHGVSVREKRRGSSAHQ